MDTPAIMFQGTGSDVGKSLVVAGLARALTNRGLRVCPFKPQNMSNNAAVAADGGEIGRAQALQARAARIAPSVDMNPVLLKPQSEIGAQIIVLGHRRGNADARTYQSLRRGLLPEVIASFERIGRHADIVLIEGAGSPAEINLRDGDIANMGFARAVNVPVVLVGDIERGGVIAAIVGTMAVLDDGDRAAIRGFIINKFRGDPRLFDDGLRAIEERTGLAGLGVIPFFEQARRLPAEDALALARPRRVSGGAIRIAVLQFARIANFDDFDPLAAETSVALDFIAPGRPIPGNVDLVIMPGSKATLADLRRVCAEGWDIDIRAHVRRGGRVLGICGGYQMLGRRVSDPDGIEGPPGETMAGLALLDVETTLTGDKTLREAVGIEIETGAPVKGYEMHVGRTTGPDCARPFLRLASGIDGARSPDGRIAGGYLHQLFVSDAFRSTFLARLGQGQVSVTGYDESIDQTLDALAAHLERHVAVDKILQIANART